MLQTKPDADWWRQAVIYQIYPRSFSDSNGDGIGDLKGISSRADYLNSLGIDAVWLSPFYPSPLADGGYDVADYRDVDPRIGTLEDFDEMVSAFRKHDIKIMIDIVPNHTSTDHVLFKKALESPKGSKERELFIFRDGLGPNKDQLPNDWESAFGGPAWTATGKNDGQFYYHMFDKGQPDWNWDNPAVREDFHKTLRFWGDRGVAGFRVDVASACAKDMSEPYPKWADLKAQHARSMQSGYNEVHPLYDRDEVQEIYAGWRKVFNEYDPPLVAVAEAWVSPERSGRYASKDSLGQSFSFDVTIANFDAESYRQQITSGLEFAGKTGSSTTWVLSNHDLVRHATRFGLPDHQHEMGDIWSIFSSWGKYLAAGLKDPEYDLKQGTRRGKAATLFILALPGCTYFYQGEELGLPEVAEIPASERQDPMFIRTNGAMVGRDGCRVPLPWDSTKPNFGYTTGKPHLPQPDYFKDYCVDVEDKDALSTLNFYRRATALRKELQTAEVLDWEESEKGVLHFRRPGGWHVVMNTNATPVTLPPGEILYSSNGKIRGNELPGETSVWLQL